MPNWKHIFGVTNTFMKVTIITIVTMESLWFSGRASERGIGRSEVRFLIGTQNFFSLSHARDKTKNTFLYFFTEQNLPSLLLLSTSIALSTLLILAVCMTRVI